MGEIFIEPLKSLLEYSSYLNELCYTLVLTDQGLYACGDNSYGQLGLRHNKACIMALTLVDQVPSELRQFQALYRQLNALIRLSQTENPLPAA